MKKLYFTTIVLDLNTNEYKLLKVQELSVNDYDAYVKIELADPLNHYADPNTGVHARKYKVTNNIYEGGQTLFLPQYDEADKCLEKEISITLEKARIFNFGITKSSHISGMYSKYWVAIRMNNIEEAEMIMNKIFNSFGGLIKCFSKVDINNIDVGKILTNVTESIVSTYKNIVNCIIRKPIQIDYKITKTWAYANDNNSNHIETITESFVTTLLSSVDNENAEIHFITEGNVEKILNVSGFKHHYGNAKRIASKIIGDCADYEQIISDTDVLPKEGEWVDGIITHSISFSFI